MPDKKISLKEAVAKGKLEQFIKENEGEAGDKEAFDKAISLMAKGKSPKVPATSSREKPEN